MHKLVLISLLLVASSLSLSAQNTADGFLQSYFPKVEAEDFDFEDTVTLILNVIRMHPQEAAEAYKASRFYDSTEVYDRSLLADLRSLKPIDHKLEIDTALTAAARCHALHSGHKSHVGHDRIAPCPENFDAECIQYGIQYAIYVIVELLEDYGIEDLAHRKILLSPAYRRIGVAQEPHRTARYGTVVDLGR